MSFNRCLNGKSLKIIKLYLILSTNASGMISILKFFMKYFLFNLNFSFRDTLFDIINLRLYNNILFLNLLFLFLITFFSFPFLQLFFKIFTNYFDHFQITIWQPWFLRWSSIIILQIILIFSNSNWIKLCTQKWRLRIMSINKLFLILYLFDSVLYF